MVMTLRAGGGARPLNGSADSMIQKPGSAEATAAGSVSLPQGVGHSPSSGQGPTQMGGV